MASSDRVLHIAGTPVRFPHVPYRAQSALMHATITAISSSKHALVESPTGTGKTLALLCASLAYQDAAIQRQLCQPPEPEPALPPRNPKLEPKQHGKPNVKTDPKHEPKQKPKQESNLELLPQVKPEPTVNHNPNSAPPPPPHPDASDSESDFAAPTKFRNVSWQHSIRDKKPSTAPPPEEQPANAFMFSRLASLERDRPLDPGYTQGPASQAAPADDDPVVEPDKQVPRIFYATRTHKQVAQVISELRKTPYRPAISVLASRREYCINDDVRTGPARDETCKSLVKLKQCPHYFAASLLADHGELLGEAWDIEELVQLGRKHGGCPYYASHELYKSAQLIFCPYNFLVDPIVRAASGISLTGDVVILDEAHNIENFARESTGFEADVADMRRACDEVDTLVLTGNFTGKKSSLGQAYGMLKGPLEAFMTLVDTVVANDELKRFDRAENAVFERDALMGKLTAADVNKEQIMRWRAAYEFVINSSDDNLDVKHIQKMREAAGIDLTPEESNAGSTGADIMMSNPKPPMQGSDQIASTNASAVLQSAAGTTTALLGYGYGCDPNANGDRLNIPTSSQEPTRKLKRAKLGDKVKARRRGRKRGNDDSQKQWVSRCLSMTQSLLTAMEYFFAYPSDFSLVVERETVSFVTAIKVKLFCLNAAVCFRDVSTKARSVIVTSGTLSPISSFAGELGTEFHISKSLPHVIDVRKQLFVSVVGEGPGKEPFIGTFAGSSKFSFQDSLGDALLDYCRVIPGGVLVFFPSYRLMELLHDRWRNSGTWDKLLTIKGAVFVEPHQRGDDFDQLVEQYYKASESDNGAVLFGVCRGKLSEGVDFRDATSRAVILVGIPFPYFGDVVVTRKRLWNDRARINGISQLQSGAEWYEMQAYRALNQALGRAVRHRFDYGAILLLDTRFRKPQVFSQLSKWAQAGVQNSDGSHNALLQNLEHFYSTVQEKIAATVVNRQVGSNP